MKKIDFGNKPSGTKIQVTKSAEFFEIYIPPFGLHPVLLFIAPFTIIWNWGITKWTLLATLLPSPVNILLMIFSLLFLAAGGFLVYICLFILFGKTHFRIDQYEVSLIKTLFGQKVSRKNPESKCEITKLVFTREHFYLDSDGDRVNQPADLKVEIGTKSFQLGGVQSGIKQEAEIEWLAFEVSEWLDQPLTIIESPVIC